MAKRLVYTPQSGGLVKKDNVEFKWYPGFSLQQKQRSIAALHAAAENKLKLTPFLEISSKSPLGIGRKLSAFNLILADPDWAK